MDRFEAMRAFVRVVELGSFTQTARELHVKQSTVSKWIRQLEEMHHTTLIQRTSRTQRVTEAGQIFYTRSKEILAMCELAHTELHTHTTTLVGRLRISLPVVIGERFFLEPLIAFAAAHTEVELEMVFDDRYVNLLEGGFDLAIRIGRPVDSSLHAITLANVPRMLVASPAYVETHGRPESPEDLIAHAALLHGLHQDDHWHVHNESGQMTRVPLKRAHVSANHSQVLLELARQGFGVAMLASWLVEDSLESGELVELLPNISLLSAHVQALSPSAHLSLRARTLVDTLKLALGS